MEVTRCSSHPQYLLIPPPGLDCLLSPHLVLPLIHLNSLILLQALALDHTTRVLLRARLFHLFELKGMPSPLWTGRKALLGSLRIQSVFTLRQQRLSLDLQGFCREHLGRRSHPLEDLVSKAKLKA